MASVKKREEALKEWLQIRKQQSKRKSKRKTKK
jgi:hypothetical protein